MSHKTRSVRPGPSRRTVRTHSGKVLQVPENWTFVKPGDATITRRVKKVTHWEVRYKKRRRSSTTYAKGVWAPSWQVDRIRREVRQMRQSEEYRRTRQKRLDKFRGEFVSAVLDVLDFAPHHDNAARRLAKAVADHAAAPGSGTVVRRHQIPMKKRARLAIYAWLRHNTTDYDTMSISRGRRSEVKRRLHRESTRLLERYRDPQGSIAVEKCPLQAALFTESDEQPKPTRRIINGEERRLFTVD